MDIGRITIMDKDTKEELPCYIQLSDDGHELYIDVTGRSPICIIPNNDRLTIMCKRNKYPPVLTAYAGAEEVPPRIFPSLWPKTDGTIMGKEL